MSKINKSCCSKNVCPIGIEEKKYDYRIYRYLSYDCCNICIFLLACFQERKNMFFRFPKKKSKDRRWKFQHFFFLNKTCF